MHGLDNSLYFDVTFNNLKYNSVKTESENFE